MRMPSEEALETSERLITVLFTDITGFTGLSERMAPDDVAALLNHHFSMIAACVEAEGGTIDKYLGDSVMAFWGAPERYEDSADRACRTAIAIARAAHAENAARQARGEAPIRLRIGIHKGSVVVGNIGSPGRVNYTVVGDSVNIAERLQEIGKVLGRADQDVEIVVSGTAAAALGPGFRLSSIGLRRVRGRDERIETLLLEWNEDATAAEAEETQREQEQA